MAAVSSKSKYGAFVAAAAEVKMPQGYGSGV